MEPVDPAHDVDVLVIGAGFGGLCALHELRAAGRRAVVLERADGVGGTWQWNRYPGARCDIESVEYSYSFSKEVEDEWTWTEVLPAQPEIERYLNFVADRLDLRRDIRFGTTVRAMTWDAVAAVWLVETVTDTDTVTETETGTGAGERWRAPFVVAATGILSAPLTPDIPGVETFAGTTLFTSTYPPDGVDLTGRRVGIVGTGSSGVQATPVVAAQAAHLHVFQRSAAYTLPSNARPFEPGEFEELRSRYDEIREAQRASFVGAARLSAFSVLAATGRRPSLKDATREDQLQAIDERGVMGALMWRDVLFDLDANRMATALYGEAVARIVHDPRTAAALVPTYPFGCKRPIIDQGYYETFNRENVTLVDLRAAPIVEVTPAGIRTEDATYDLDVIIWATGFDAITGALDRIDIRGRDGALLRDVWASDGPGSYLGLAVAGFPNLFMIQGPASPAATANYVTAAEHQVGWIVDCLSHLGAHERRSIEAQPAAQLAWMEHTASIVEGTIVLDPTCHSWWNGANVPGKARRFLSYSAGAPEHRRRCDEVAADGYRGFVLA